MRPAGGGRDDAIREFAATKDPAILLIDSEGPEEEAWKKLTSNRMPRSKKSDLNRMFLMVQCMESWFLADLGATLGVLPVKHRRQLSTTQPIEDVSAKDLFKKLKRCGCNGPQLPE